MAILNNNKIVINRIMLPNEFMGKNLHNVTSANSSSKSEVTLAVVTPLSNKTSLIFVKVSLVNRFGCFKKLKSKTNKQDYFSRNLV